MKLTTSLLLLAGHAIAAPGTAYDNNQPVLNERDGGGGGLNDRILGTARVGDGNPHQAYLYKQVTHSISCDPHETNGCSISREDAQSFSIDFSGGVTALWIDGGFAVSKEVSTGQTGTCNGGAGDTVCVWYRTAHTAYTVQKYAFYRGRQKVTDGQKIGDPYVIWSPNKNAKGSGYVCALNKDCENMGAEWWVSMALLVALRIILLVVNRGCNNTSTRLVS